MEKENTFVSLIRSLINVLQSANQLVPFFTFVLIFLIAIIVWATSVSTMSMLAVVLLFVLFISLVVFMRSFNFGEAALALSAGLLTAFSVQWTINRFIAFITIVSGFSLLSFLILSLRLAARLESIYHLSAILIAPDNSHIKETANLLKNIINKSTPLRQMDAINRALAVQIMAFRKIPINEYENALEKIESFAVAMGVDYQSITRFVCDLLKINPHNFNSLDTIYNIIRNSSVPPSDFFEAFQNSRSRFLGHPEMAPTYFRNLRTYLESGIHPKDISEAFNRQHR